MFEGYQLNYCWILKIVSGLGILKLMYVFVPSVCGENIPIAEFEMISAETVCWDIERE